MERLTHHDLIERYAAQIDKLRTASSEERKAIAQEIEFTKKVAAAVFSVQFSDWLVFNFPEIVTDDWRKECEERNQRAAIRNCSRDFKGKMSDERCMKWLDMPKTVFYQRKKELWELAAGVKG